MKPTRPYHKFTAYHREPGGLRRLDWFVERVEELCAARQVKSLRILDVGCGNGNLAIPLSYLGHEVTGVDYDDPSVNQARNVAKDFSLPAEFITGSLEQVQGRQFDVVLASEVLEHQTNPKKLLEDCRRLCAPQGILLLSVPNGRSWEEQLRFLTTQTSSGQRIKQLVKRRLKHEKIQSLAAHPHEFFFSYRSLDRVLFGTGWKIKNSAATAAWFKEFYYLLGRLWMKRSSAWFHACDASDAWLAKHLCLGLGDGWLVEAQMFDASRPSVVEVVDTLNAGGAERVVHELCSRLPEQGFDVQAYALLRGGELEKDFRSASIPLTVGNSRWPFGLDTFCRLYKFLRRERPQIVHTHLLASDIYARLAARLARVPVVISTEHNVNEDYGRIRRCLQRLSNLCGTAWVAISQTVHAHMVADQGVKSGRITLIPNGIDMARVLERPARHFRDVPRILTLSRLTRQKDLATLLKALALVKNEWRLQVAGAGELERELKALAQRLGLESRVEFLGYRSDASELLAQADIFCFPSRWEGMGLAVLEAGVAGVPAILSDLPVLHELMEDDEAKFVRAGDVPAWAAALRGMLDDPESAVSRAQKAKARLRQAYSAERMAAQYAELFNRLLLPLRKKEHPLVIHVVPTLFSGGAERLVVELAKRQPALGYRTEVIANYGGGPLEDELREAKVRYEIHERSGPFNVVSVFRLYKLFRQRRPDIVHTHLFGADLWGRLAAWCARVPLIVSTEHNVNLQDSAFKKSIKRVLGYSTDAFIAVSETARDYMVLQEHIRGGKVTVVKNGVDMLNIRPRAPELPHGEFRLVSVGRLTAQKDQATLIKAAALIINRPWRLGLIGTGELEAELRSLAQELGVAERVEFLGQCSDVYERLANYDIYCSASRWEGLPLTVVEAAAAGLPLVLSDIRQMREVMGEDEAAFFKPGDQLDMVQAMQNIMDDYGSALTVAAKASVRIRQEFSIQRMVQEYADVYQTARLLRGKT